MSCWRRRIVDFIFARRDIANVFFTKRRELHVHTHTHSQLIELTSEVAMRMLDLSS